MAIPIVKESPITLREALLPYIVAGINMLAPTLAARDLLAGSSKNAPLIFVTTITFILLGLPFSIFARQRGYHRILLNLLVLVPLLVLTWTLARDHPGFQVDWANPVMSAMASDGWSQLEAMLLVFVLLAAGRAFLILSSEDMLQTPIPGLIIFLLTVITTDVEAHLSLPMIACMLCYFTSAVYLISHEHNQQWFNQHASFGFQRRLLVWTLLVCFGLTPVVIVGAALIKPFNMYTLARAGAHRQLPRWRFDLFGGNNVGIGFEQSLDVGGANWPGGKQPIMTVTVSTAAPQNLLWRGGTYNTYDRGKWSNAALPQRIFAHRPDDEETSLTSGNDGPATVVWMHPRSASSDPGIAAWMREHGQTESPPREWLVHQQVVFDKVRTMGGRVPIYSAYQFYRMKASNAAFRDAQAGSDGSVYLPNVRRYLTLDNYEVESIVKPLPTMPGWKLTTNPRLPAEQQAAYTQLPGGKDSPFAGKLRGLAQEILARNNREPGELNAFDKVRQLELYLGQHYKYTLTPKAPKNGGDPIDAFLFTEKQGYCVYFSGAMVLLCRSLNIPARLVVGFATGETDPEAEQDEENDEVIYRVTSEHAHAWAEVYLPNYGWYTSDPTAGSSEVPNLWGQTWDTITEMVTIIKNNFLDLTAALKRDPALRGRMIAGGALLLLLVGVVLYLRRDRPPAFPKGTLTPAEVHAAVHAAYHRMHRWLRRWGVMKPEGYTAREFDQAFSAINPVLGVPVSELSALYLRAEYSDVPLDDADARRAIELLHELWRLAGSERKHLQQTDVEA